MLARRHDPKFKAYLAERLWALHERDRDVLNDGYSGPNDMRLVAFVKEHWMRRNYGGKVSQIVRDLARETETYGPGWRCDVFAAGDGNRPAGVTVAESLAARFFASLPNWSADVTTFLDACQYIGQHADVYRGVVFTDPLDGAEIRWNPVERATKKIVVGAYKLEARLPGRLVKTKFRPLPANASGEYPVGRTELKQLVAPCLVHTLDAYFSALVLAELRWEGISNVVAVHDGWFVPAFHNFVDRPGGQTGQYFLDQAIRRSGHDWLAGLGAIYHKLVILLTGSPYQDFALQIRSRWRERVAAGRWPTFTAS